MTRHTPVGMYADWTADRQSTWHDVWGVATLSTSNMKQGARTSRSWDELSTDPSQSLSYNCAVHVWDKSAHVRVSSKTKWHRPMLLLRGTHVNFNNSIRSTTKRHPKIFSEGRASLVPLDTRHPFPTQLPAALSTNPNRQADNGIQYAKSVKMS